MRDQINQNHVERSVASLGEGEQDGRNGGHDSSHVWHKRQQSRQETQRYAIGAPMISRPIAVITPTTAMAMNFPTSHHLNAETIASRSLSILRRKDASKKLRKSSV